MQLTSIKNFQTGRMDILDTDLQTYIPSLTLLQFSQFTTPSPPPHPHT